MNSSAEREKIGQAAGLFVNLAIDELADERGVHAETVIAGVARMAGTFLFRSFGFQLPDAKPGQPVLSEAANERGPRLVGILSTVLADAAINADLNKVDDASRQGHEPLQGFLATQTRLEPLFNKARKDLDLSYEQAAEASVLASAMLIQQTTEIVDPNVSFDLAVFSIVEGSKTQPAAT
jgi:hypothetical protein